MEEATAHVGLGLGTRGEGGWLVFDARLAAPRGAAYSAGAQGDDDDVGPLDEGDGYPAGEAAAPASMSTPLDAGNKGYQLLAKMGWTAGKGLGRNENGIVEPVSAGIDAGVRLGLGKQAEDDKYTAAENISRRKLEAEIQADEDPERTKRREAQVARDEAIKQDVTEILRTFYCQVCSKQYATAMELEEHLSSYDHHHKKRLAEARAAELERTRGERQRKEVKRQQREQQRLEEQIRKAQAAAASKQQAQPPPLPPGQPPLVPGQPAGAGGWGWAQQPAAAPPPPPPAASSGWMQQPAAAAGAPPPPPLPPGAPLPPPPPPPPPGAPPPPPGASPPPPPAAGGGSMRLGMLGRGRAGAAAGGIRPATFGRGRGRAGGAAALGKPGAAAAMFGESSSDEEGGGA